jgi:hypothetical protein
MDEYGGDTTLDKFSECSRADIEAYIQGNINSDCVTEGTSTLGNTGASVPTGQRLKRRSRLDEK